ncbi:MAG: hypothetical protein L0Z07_05250, partial [Planctomycetes bacterium]|nr:hypothetical protein [Planctomycetota bacterium]
AKQVMQERLATCCPVCAGDVGPFEVSAEGCGVCRDEQPRIIATLRVGGYDGKAGALVRQFKFHERADVEPLLVEWLADRVAAASWADRVEAVTYVPTHWRRMIKGRPHVARALARGIAQKLDLPCASLLRRTRAGPRQVGLSYAQRFENIRGAFSLISGARLRAARVLIVDDVRTTGATLEECAKAIRRGDRSCEVYGAVAARARGADDDLLFI